ncbi:hypothetical protein ALI22I_28055 [Saccharothrix sp. ALI-22-I]|uniref:CHAP domain-containing protein n=1 Tax=Saccharothrix sp. ALI-22-I TaxID=1933778 RepID=UPI00097C61AD|nr:CHAP domain-containing protein [Saccharothrix sp. ALI-22-I]ONI85629.1 hypothetical protein ALI22I_28055 [Saccharothrix sp. ALI-22-I]
MSIKTTVRRTVTAALATAVLAPVLALASIGSAVADGRTDIRDLARANINHKTCDMNSLGVRGYMGSCEAAHAWCADFARWVWRNAGFSIDRLNAGAGSFYLYGQNNGTLHIDPGYVPQIGDAVVFGYVGNSSAEHVALVDTVNGTSMTTINGNFGGTPLTSSVRYATGGARVGQYVGSQRISAFVSPAGAGDSARALTKRIGVLTEGKVLGKQGDLDAGWANPIHGGGVVKSKFDGDMVGVLDSAGVLWVKQGVYEQDWFRQTENVKDFALESATGRVGVVFNDGSATVKEGGPQGHWVPQGTGVAELTMSGDWIGAVTTEGKALVKQGGLKADWTDQTAGVKRLEIDAKAGRIGVLTVDGRVVVKDGGLNGTDWVEQAPNVVDFELSGTWIGVVQSGGTASVKEGALRAEWGSRLDGIKDVEIDAAIGRLGFLRTDNTLVAKDGGIYGTQWREVTPGVTSFQVTSY